MWRMLFLCCCSVPVLAQPCQSTANPAILVELFTSEGCSSCPPADAWLAQMAQQFDPQQVITLAWHVDYWDYIGWKDELASAQFSARQRQRVQAARSDSMYTPQLMVNGQTHFWHEQAKALIQQQLAAAAPPSLQFSAQLNNNNEWQLQLKPRVLPPNTVLRAALIGDTQTRKIKAGENSGRTLTHPSPVLAYVEHVSDTVSFKRSSAKPVRAVVWLERLNQSEVLAVSSLNLAACVPPNP